MKRYHTYKDSGIEWLGEIPEHWEIYRIDELTKIVRGNTSFKRDELLEEGQYVALQYGKVYNVDEVNRTYNFYINENFYKIDQIVNFGNTILISTSETVEDLGHSSFYNRKDLGLLGGEQILLNPFSNLIIGKYLYYYSRFFCRELRKYATGIKVFRYNIYDLKQIKLAIPLLPEQTAIVQYLDTKTQAIDQKVRLLEKKIGYYKELRQSIINEAVTKGLDNKVELKDSGIDWIGQIPEHWEVKRIKGLGNLETSSVNKKIEEKEEMVKLINYTNVYGNSKMEIWDRDNYMVVSAKQNQIRTKNLKKGDVLFTPSSETIKDIGVSAVVMEDLNQTLYSYHLLRLRFRKKVALSFKKYLFNNDFVQFYMSQSATGTTRKILGLNTVYNTPIILPTSLDEQTAIAQYLDQKTQTIDRITANIQKQIATLKELRKTLINEVVTGKKRVYEPKSSAVV